MVEADGLDDNIIRCMCLACWITKATNTHLEYVVLTAFPQHQWYMNVRTLPMWLVLFLLTVNRYDTLTGIGHFCTLIVPTPRWFLFIHVCVSEWVSEWVSERARSRGGEWERTRTRARPDSLRGHALWVNSWASRAVFVRSCLVCCLASAVLIRRACS